MDEGGDDTDEEGNSKEEIRRHQNPQSRISISSSLPGDVIWKIDKSCKIPTTCDDENIELKKPIQDEMLQINDINNSNFITKIFHSRCFPFLKELKFFNCFIKFESDKIQKEISTLMHLSFEKCDGDFYKIFIKQKSVEKITIINEDQVFDGFSHEDFNKLMEQLPNVKHLVLRGAGTASYFYFGHYPFAIEKLETDEIAFNSKITFENQGSEVKMDLLKSQQESLKELRIKNLPVNSQGQIVIKYIMKDMQLQNVYYGETALIKEGKIQNIYEISACAEQIYSCVELLKICPGIKILKLILNETDMDTAKLLNFIEFEKKFFEEITELRVIDKSGYMRLLNVFQELFTKFLNLQTFILESQDRNINAVLEYCLGNMKKLEELHLDYKASRESKRLEIIKDKLPMLKKLFIDEKSVNIADIEFKKDVDIKKDNKV